MAWTRGPTIGRGSTATVSIAATSSGDIFAVKSTHLASAASLLRNEHSLISQLSSPHIIRCLGSDEDESVYNLFLEYSGGGSLSDLIRKQGGALDEKSIRFYSQQLLLGLEYLHRNGIVHCDIKGQNILIAGDGLKIADFGCAKLAESDGAFSGTPAYMAPEVCRGEEQSFAADVWAAGCTVVEMATGCHPWPEMKDPAAAIYRIAFSGEVPELPSYLSGDARDFVEKCLVRDPEQRWTAAELLRHPFLDNCGGIGEVARRSPTSVTDQGFWDALEVAESVEILTEVTTELPSESPSRRIGALIGDYAPRWWDIEDDQEWVTVRGIDGIEEFDDLNQDFEEEEILASNLILLGDYSYKFCNGDSNCTSPFEQNQCVEYFLYSQLSFSKSLMELFLHQDQVSIQLFHTLTSQQLIDFVIWYHNNLATILSREYKNTIIYVFQSMHK